MSETTQPVYDDADMIVEIPLTPGGLGDIRKNLALDFTHQPAVNMVKETKPDLPGHEHMKVYLRVRPFMEHELENNENQNTIHQDTEHTLTVHAPKDSVTFKNTAHGCAKQTNNFTFSKIFNDTVQQKGFFEETMLGTVKDFVDGQNCLMFTYGVTGSGKTYTILGKPNDSGILPRSLDVVFNSIEGKQWGSMSLKPHMFCDVITLSETQQEIEQKVKDKVFRLSIEEDVDMSTMMGEEMSEVSRSTVNMTTGSLPSLTGESTAKSLNASDDNTQVQLEQLFEDAKHRDREQAAIDVEAQGQIRFSIWVSFAEIYNEYIYDLLDPIPKKKTSRRAVLKLASDKTGAPYIKGLKWIHVTTADEAYKLLTIGQRNLQTACTKLNQNSSRSHCIFTMKLLRVVDKENPYVARVSMLSFCDLAGSERYSKTRSSGERLREAGSINRSLLTLGQCIDILRHNQTHKTSQRIVPFRESKLTRLFQNFFSGKGRASMVVNINQNASMFDETLHVLKFSAIAKQVTSVQKEEKKPKKLMSLSMGPDGRASVAWATPGSMQRWIEEEDEEKLQTVDEEEESQFEEVAEENNQVNQKLMDIIEKLRDQLKQDRMKMAMMELEIREEVCNEMASQLVKIEQDYSDRMEEQRYQAEERADQKLTLYMASIKKTRKRARLDRFQDDDDEYVSTVILHQEKVKVQDLENEKKSLQEQLTKTRFELSAVKQQLEKGVTFEKSVLLNDSSDITNNELMENMAQQLEDSKSKLSQQEEQMMQLNDMLTEAGDMFEMKEIEIEKLKTVIHDNERRIESLNETMEDLRQVAVDSKQAIEEAEVKMKAQDDTIRRLQAELTERDNQVSKLQKASSANETQISDLQCTIDALAVNCEDLRSQIEIEKCDYEYAKAKSSDSDAQVSETLRKHEAEKLQHSEATRRIKELEARLEKPEGVLSITFMEVKREDLENELFQEREERSHAEEKMGQLEQKIAELEAVTRAPVGTGAEVDAMIEKLRQELSGEVRQANIEKANMLTKLEMFEEDFEKCDERLTIEMKQNTELQTSLEGLKAELNAVNEKFAREVNLKEQVERGFEKLKECQEQTENKLLSMEDLLADDRKHDEQARSELEAANNRNARLEQEAHDRGIQSLQHEEEAAVKISILQAELEKAGTEMEKLVGKEAERVKGLKKNIKKLKAESECIPVLEKELEDARVQLAVLQGQIDDAKTENATMRLATMQQVRLESDKAAGLQSEVEEIRMRTGRLADLEKELEDSSGKVVELEEELKIELGNASRLEQELKALQVEVERLRNVNEDLEGANKTIQGLKKDLNDANQKVKVIEQELETASSQSCKVMELESELEGLRTDTRKVERMEVQLGEIRVQAERSEHLEEELRLVKEQNEKFKNLEGELDTVRTQLQTFEKTKGELRFALSELMSLEDELKSMQAELKDVKQELKLSVESAGNLEQTLTDVRKEKEAMLADAQKNSQIQEELLVTQVGDLKSTNAALEREKEDLLVKVRESKRRIDDLQTDMDSDAKQHLESTEVIRRENELLLNSIESLKKEFEGTHAGLMTRIAELESSLEETYEELSLQSMSKERAEEQRAQMEARLKKSQSRLEKAEMTVVDVIKHREKAEENVEKLQKKVSGLTEECNELKGQISEAEVLEQKVQDLEAEVEKQIAQLGAEIGDKSSEVECLQEKVKELEAAANKHTMLREELEANVEEQRAMKSEGVLAIANLRQTLEEQISLQSELKQNLAEKVGEVEGYRVRIGDVEASLAKEKSQIQDLESKVAEEESQKKMSTEELENALETIAALKQDLQEANSYITEQNSRLDSLEVKFNSRENKKDASLQEMREKLKCETVSMQSQSGGIENIDPAASGIDLSILNIPMESFSGQVNIPSPSPEPVKRKARGRPKKKRINESECKPVSMQSRSGGIENIDPAASGIDLSILNIPMESFSGQVNIPSPSPEPVKRKACRRPKKKRSNESECKPVSMQSQSGGIENIDPAASGIDFSILNIPMESFSGQVNIPSPSPEPVKRKARGRPKKKRSNESECKPVSMQSQSGGIENIDPAASGIDLSILNIPMESFSGQVNIPSPSPGPVKRKARGRPKKKRSNESEQGEEEPTKTTAIRRTLRTITTPRH
ncbi:kinesin-like protein KIF20B isoform X2 [Lineus longissimus]|uniref:kinesin-like protein KIF20B isoform X2 n=1 Tax=Lineus longissimus TaxID=88925 RepID=UPI00315C8243